jgi:hypothetical protein
VEYPDLTVRVLAGQLRTRTQGSGDDATSGLTPEGTTPAPEFFVPPGSRRYGVAVSLGESVPETWTRGLRPYGGLELTRNSRAGAGYNLRLGLRGSLLGLDHLALYWSHGRNVGASNDSSVEYGIRYEYNFGV